MFPISLNTKKSRVNAIKMYAEEKDTPPPTKRIIKVDSSISDKKATTKKEVANANNKDIPLELESILS